MEDQNQNQSPAKPQTSSVHLLFILVCFLVIIAAVGYYLNPDFFSRKSTTPKLTDQIVTEHNMLGETPKLISTLGFVQEVNVVPIESYTSHKDTLYQDTYRYTSKYNVKLNTALYTNFLNRRGWSITASTTDDALFSSLTAKKDIFNVTINSSFNTLRNESTVDITLDYHFTKSSVPASK